MTKPELARLGRHISLLIFCCSAALSIVVTQIALGLYLVFWLYETAPQLYRRARDPHARLFEPFFQMFGSYFVPASIWIGVCFLTACTGIDPARSLEESAKLALSLLFPMLVALDNTATRESARENVGKLWSYCFCIIGGQLIAASHTVYESFANQVFDLRIPGPVTESGQLAIVLPILCGVLLVIYRAFKEPERKPRFIQQFAISMLIALLLLTNCWVQNEGRSGEIINLALLGAAIFGLALTRGSMKLPAYARRVDFRLLFMSLALLSAAFILNLKRGPWMGCFIAVLFLAALMARRRVLPIIVISAALLLTFQPVRQRVLNFEKDFTISGGRQSMWTLGLEIVERYPLGLGVRNVSYMRELDPTLPSTHRHMHNNLLTVATETGALGMFVFLWWMLSTLKLGFKAWKSLSEDNDSAVSSLAILALASVAAIGSWQIAGLVEYNFGDGEVRYLALFLMGIILHAHRTAQLQIQPRADKVLPLHSLKNVPRERTARAHRLRN